MTIAIFADAQVAALQRTLLDMPNVDVIWERPRNWGRCTHGRGTGDG